MNTMEPITITASPNSIDFLLEELHNFSRTHGMRVVREMRTSPRSGKLRVTDINEVGCLAWHLDYCSEKNRGGFADCTGGATPSLRRAFRELRDGLREQGYDLDRHQCDVTLNGEVIAPWRNGWSDPAEVA